MVWREEFYEENCPSKVFFHFFKIAFASMTKENVQLQV